MIYLKYFESTDSNTTLKEKLESIVDMAYYLFDNNMKDSLSNYIGNCSVLFTGACDISRGFWRNKYPLRFYMFDVDQLVKIIESGLSNGRHVTTNDKIELIDKLYKLSKVERFSDAISDIEHMLEPLTSLKSAGKELFKNHSIGRFYRTIWANSKYLPCYDLKLKFEDDIFGLSSSQINNLRTNFIFNGNNVSDKEAKDILSDTESEFYSYMRYIKMKINNMNMGKYEFEIIDNSHLKDFYNLCILLIPKE